MISEHGRGVFVRPAPQFDASHPTASQGGTARAAKRRSPSKQRSPATPQVDNIAVSHGKPDPVVAERLRLSSDDDVVIRSRRYLADGRPVETATSYIPAAFARGTKIEQIDTGPGGIYARLEEAGHTLNRFTEEVGARMPTPEERRALQLATGVPVLTVVRTAYDTNDVAVEVCDTVKVASAYLLEYDFSAR